MSAVETKCCAIMAVGLRIANHPRHERLSAGGLQASLQHHGPEPGGDMVRRWQTRRMKFAIFLFYTNKWQGSERGKTGEF